MVNSVTSLTGRGLRDWLIQRVTALVMLVYAVVFLVFWCRHPEIDYRVWYEFFACRGIKVLNTLFWISLMLHAWIGLWTVTTDYLKALWLRLTVQIAIFLGLGGLFVWGMLIFWGV